MSAMTSNFGGKKAAPFRKGGKPRKAIMAKAVVAKAKRAKREMALSVITGREIDLAGKWKHGWIPLDATAAAIKAHKGGGHNAVGSREEHAAALTKHIKEASSKSRAASEPGNWYDTPTHTSPTGRTASIGVSHSDGKAYYGSTVTTAGGERMHVRHNSAKAAHEHVMNALYPSSGISFPSNPHNQGGLEASRARAREAAAKKTSKGAISFPKNEHNSGGLEASRVRSGGLSNQALIDNAAKMHGTGSKQHLAAKARFGGASDEKTLGDVVAKEHGFSSYTAYRAHIKAAEDKSLANTAAAYGKDSGQYKAAKAKFAVLEKKRDAHYGRKYGK